MTKKTNFLSFSISTLLFLSCNVLAGNGYEAAAPSSTHFIASSKESIGETVATTNNAHQVTLNAEEIKKFIGNETIDAALQTELATNLLVLNTDLGQQLAAAQKLLGNKSVHQTLRLKLLLNMLHRNLNVGQGGVTLAQELIGNQNLDPITFLGNLASYVCSR